jgi:hypothetical protein
MYNRILMSTFHMILLLIGSFTLTKKISELVNSIKKKNKEKIKVDILFLFLTLFLIGMLLYLKSNLM